MDLDYYLVPQSPWTYLGHRRLHGIALQHGARIRLKPFDLGGRVFPVSGGLPLSKRAPQRQAYRLLELDRHAKWLGLPINRQPRYFPVAGDDAARLIIAVDQHDGVDAGMRMADFILRAVWVNELSIADDKVLADLLHKAELPERRLDDSRSQSVQEAYERYTQEAIDAGVFGAPSYVIDGEIFWGQDRLDFVERRLAEGSVR